MDENHLEQMLDGGLQDSSIHISDVIEVIETDPDFGQSTMYNGGGVENPQTLPQVSQQSRRRPFVKITEQPASKALRFRYECEGRSAGSIPGASSTPENKTFPSIQVIGYQGRAVVVVSCVTKEEPYKPHPHNLVGREGCKKGVCTLEISPETMCVTFSNLGIQCVKKKDIENALRVREEIKVDPFMTGFGHRNQPTSIDLNAVRLCFQVFLQDERRGKFTVPLAPVVSEPIYDKKAMCDLQIIKLSHCVNYVDGGRNEIILLCEKVAKEDIQVRFFEEKDRKLVWEGFGEFQPSQVHKQTAICFKAPRYRTLDITEPVKVSIQLRRPSDGAVSEALPFELLPLDSGRPLGWSFRRDFNKRSREQFLNSLFENLVPKNTQVQVSASHSVVEPEEVELNNNVNNNNSKDYEEKTFNELINQVDELYSENQTRLSNQETLNNNNKNDFEDNITYSSLQLAYKNPVALEQVVQPQSSPTSITNKREIVEIDQDKPPLPPKRTKKIETYIGNSMQSINLTSPPSVTISRSHSFNVTRKSPVPSTTTLPNPKKRGFLSKLFCRKSKTAANSRESLAPTLRASSVGKNSEKSITKSSGNISSNSIRIPLRDDLNQLDLEKSDDDLLTEAEHYALYTAVAPHATQSEFDEMSCYYAPVEGGKILNKT